MATFSKGDPANAVVPQGEPLSAQAKVQLRQLELLDTN